MLSKPDALTTKLVGWLQALLLDIEGDAVTTILVGWLQALLIVAGGAGCKADVLFELADESCPLKSVQAVLVPVTLTRLSRVMEDADGGAVAGEVVVPWVFDFAG